MSGGLGIVYVVSVRLTQRISVKVHSHRRIRGAARVVDLQVSVGRSVGRYIDRMSLIAYHDTDLFTGGCSHCSCIPSAFHASSTPPPSQ